MSPWSSSPITVRVGPASVACHDRRTPALQQRPLSCNLAGAEDGADGLDTALISLLATAGSSANGATFDIDTALCRFEAVGWIEGVHARTDRLALARSRFEAVHGPAARDWRIEMAEAGFRRGALAVALSPAVPSAIVSACRAAGVRPGPIRPAVAPAIDRALRAVGRGAAWIVVADRTDAFIGLFTRAGWSAVACLPEPPERLHASLPDVLARESALADAEGDGARVLAAAAWSGDVGPPRAPVRLAGVGTLESGGSRWPFEWMGG